MVELTTLKNAHYELMVEYARVLNEVSKLHVFKYVRMPGKSHPIVTGERTGISKLIARIINSLFAIGSPALIEIRYLVKIFVESHVRKNLNHLSNNYGYLANAISESAPEAQAYTSWLKEKGEACEKMAANLLSLRSIQGAITTGLPLLAIPIGLLTAWLRVDNFYQLVNTLDSLAMVVLGVLLAITALYAFVFVATGFSYKRELFKNCLNDPQLAQSKDSSSEQTKNVYRAEDSLFALLNCGKKHEPPIDIFGQLLGIGGMGLAFVAFGLVKLATLSIVAYIMLGLGAYVIIFAIVGSVARYRQRKWR